MADITVKLIWYKLSETFSKMADAGANMESWISWDEHLLDFLLIFWISVGLLIVGVVNSLTQFFGPLQPRVSWDRATKDGGSSVVPVEGQKGQHESTFWLNSALNWVYLHYNQFPEFVGAWVQSLNEQANKLGGPVQVKIEKVQSGSLPPKFGDITHEAGPEDKYVVNCRVDSRDLSFAVFASQQTHEGVKLTNLTVTILKLKGHLKIRCFKKGQDMMAEISFHGRPDIKLQGKPVNPYVAEHDQMYQNEPTDLVDIGVVEEVVRNTICLATTTFNISQWIEPRDQLDSIPIQRTLSKEAAQDTQLAYGAGAQPSSPRYAQPGQGAAPQQLTPQVQRQMQQQQQQQQVFETIDAKEVKQQHHAPPSSAFHVPTLATPTKQQQLHQQQQQQRMSHTHGITPEKRLLVKVIKASGLKQNEGSVDPYCVVYVDSPQQTELSSVVKSTYNPFWDEQFYFDLTHSSQELRFEVLDHRRPPNDNFMGEAMVYIEDLMRNPSSRQIIPLQGRLGAGEFVSGSITVEMLCMDPSEDNSMSVSPRRTIETSKSTTPGGTIVTTTTTTTQKPQNANYSTNIDGSPSFIEKKSFEYDSFEQDAEVVHINGVESVADTAIRELKERSKQPATSKTPARVSTLIITGVKREPVVPAIKTIESSPTEDMMARSSASTTSSPQSPEITYTQPNTKERKSFASRIKKRFSRSKKRSQSADRATSSLREGSNYLRPPGPQSKDRRGTSIDSDLSLTTFETSPISSQGGRSQSLHSGSSVSSDRDDIDLHKARDEETPNLKKSRSLGGSLKKLFRRSRKRSRSLGRGEQSRESSVSRQSRHASQGPSREGSLTRTNQYPSQNPSQHDTVIL